VRPFTKKQVVEALEPLAEALAGSAVAGPCTLLATGAETCIGKQDRWRGPLGNARGYLEYRREELCPACLAYYLVDAARVHLYGLLNKEAYIEAHQKARTRRRS
jgi:hypothetical protein